MKLLLADTQPLALAGMRATLRSLEGLQIMGEAHTIGQLLEQTARYHPDLLIADLSLKGAPADEWIRAARKLSPTLKILICTARQEQSLVERVTGCGVDGYILKTESTATFAQAVRSLSQGTSWFSQEILSKMLAAKTAPGPGLTPRETDVLQLLKRGLSNRRIADCLSLAEQTVCNYVRRLNEKLNTNNRIEVVLWAREHLLAI